MTKIKLLSILFLVFIFTSCTDEEKVLYEKTKQTNTSSSYQEYLSKYAAGKYKVEIQDSLNLRLEEEIFEKAENKNTIKSYEKYLTDYKQGRFIQEAQDSIYFKKEIIVFDTAIQKMKIEAFQIVIDSFSKGRYVDKSKYYIDSLQQILAVIVKEKEITRLKKDVKKEENKTNNSNTKLTGSFTDSRDGKIYKTIIIGNQVWMAENLVFKANSGCLVYSNQSEVEKYGYLYNWKMANKVCPNGWHLPSDSEWTTLTNELGGENIAGSKLKSVTDWKLHEGKNYGNNISGFSASPGGGDYGGFFTNGFIGRDGWWWTSTTHTERHPNVAFDRGLNYTKNEIHRNSNHKLSAHSVRCIQN